MTAFPAPENIRPIPKSFTGIAGLDQVLEGGCPTGRVTLVEGGPGTGKTVLGLQFLVSGARAGEPGILVTFEEEEDILRRNSLSLGLDLPGLEREQLLVLAPTPRPDSVVSGEFDLQGFLSILSGAASDLNARRLVIDAVDVLLRLFRSNRRRQDQIYLLHDRLLSLGLTTVMTVKRTEDELLSGYQFMDFLADCVVLLDQRVAGQISTRRLRVLKYRGSGFGRNEYPYAIRPGGIRLLPITSASLDQQVPGGPVSTGIGRLDGILRGGFRKGTSILISGASGTGKTSLAAGFASAACERGERVLYVSFEESKRSLVNAMLSPGIDLRPALENGLLRILSKLPESMGVEEHLFDLFDAVDEFRPAHLVADAVSALSRMHSEKAAFDFMLRLVLRCREQGVTCLMTNQSHSSSGVREISGLGVSSLIDTVILLGYQEPGPARTGEVARRLLVMKSRGAAHSSRYHELLISDCGIDLREPRTGSPGARQ